VENNIFIPKKVMVGFQERTDTYTQKLAYVIYFDEKGVLRKENSWNSWRDHKIDSKEFDNTPTEGFVLNKKVGGCKYDWNVRNTYVRVYDPRDFEFEISIPNLLYILENTNSIKGKGLEGDFVYGWSGTELLLVPTSSPDYTAMVELNDLRHSKNNILSKDLTIGATYRHKSGADMTYMGRFDKHEDTRWEAYEVGKNLGKHYFFLTKDNKEIKIYKSLGNNFIATVDSGCISNYAELFELVERNTIYSPINPSRTEFFEYTLKELIESLLKSNYNTFYTLISGSYVKFYINKYKHISCNSREYRINKNFNTIEELYNNLKIFYRKRYLVNGKLYDNTMLNNQ
jgi:hypothetical protein